MRFGLRAFSWGERVAGRAPSVELSAYENDVGKSGGGWQGWLDISVVDRRADPGAVDFVPFARLHLICRS